MIYSNSLLHIFNTLNLNSFSEALDTHVTNVLLRPNELNINPVSLSYIQDNKQLLHLLYNNISPEEVTSNLDTFFLTLFNKNVPEIRKNIMLISKTKFLQLIVSTFIYGLLLELKDYETVLAANNPFNL